MKEEEDVIPFYNTAEITIEVLGEWLKRHKNDNEQIYIWNNTRYGYNSGFERDFIKLYNSGMTEKAIQKKMKLTKVEYNKLWRKLFKTKK